MENKDLIEPEEDLVQKSLHGEADFFKGMAKHQYKSLWSFSFGYLIAEFFIFMGLFFLGILSAGIVNAIQDKAFFYPSFIFGAIAMVLGMGLFFFLGYKILKGLIISFKENNKKFKNKVIILMIFPTLLAIFILILIFQTLPLINFTY